MTNYLSLNAPQNKPNMAQSFLWNVLPTKARYAVFHEAYEMSSALEASGVALVDSLVVLKRASDNLHACMGSMIAATAVQTTPQRNAFEGFLSVATELYKDVYNARRKLTSEINLASNLIAYPVLAEAISNRKTIEKCNDFRLRQYLSDWCEWDKNIRAWNSITNSQKVTTIEESLNRHNLPERYTFTLEKRSYE